MLGSNFVDNSYRPHSSMHWILMNQTSRIMILVEGSSPTLARSDDGHHWVGVHHGSNSVSVKVFFDSCGQEKQKIWYTIFEIDFGLSIVLWSRASTISSQGQHAAQQD